MKSKLNPDKYPIANPFEYLVFQKGHQRNIDFVFACRLAALLQHMALTQRTLRKININSGHRSIAEQIVSYKSTGGKLVKGEWTGGNGMASKPGSSWHEFRLAIDTPDAWLKALDKSSKTIDQKTLLQFGLYKPLTNGNGVYVGKKLILEDWHIQPIETAEVRDKKSMEPELYNLLKKGMKGFEVIELQYRLNRLGYKLVVDGDFGAITDGAVKDFQRNRGLVADGIVGQKTWDRLYEV